MLTWTVDDQDILAYPFITAVAGASGHSHVFRDAPPFVTPPSMWWARILFPIIDYPHAFTPLR